LAKGLEKHPCFSGDAHNTFGRMHLPVSPTCNIQCRYCKRGFNKWEASPGVSRGLLTPEQGAKTVERALLVCPEITVVGIAGPGDPLATDHALETLRRVHRRFPDLIMCLSTNGLMLDEKAEEIAEAGVRTLTVTVNAVHANIQKEIFSHLVFHDLFVTGEEAGRRLIAAQLSGIRRITELGVFVKINTVLLPGINDRHIAEIASATAKAGASMINIIPLLPRFEFLSHRPPSVEELERAQGEAERILPVFKHCRRCRADACGIPGSGVDFGRELYGRVEPTFSHG
jgi:nitrogen fixation protein NifB